MSSVLVCTDVAAMGLDVDDLNLTVNIGNNTDIKGEITNFLKHYQDFHVPHGSSSSRVVAVAEMVFQLLILRSFFLSEVF